MSSSVPSGVPSGVPSSVPSGVPSSVPSGVPSGVPEEAPSGEVIVSVNIIPSFERRFGRRLVGRGDAYVDDVDKSLFQLIKEQVGTTFVGDDKAQHDAIVAAVKCVTVVALAGTADGAATPSIYCHFTINRAGTSVSVTATITGCKLKFIAGHGYYFTNLACIYTGLSLDSLFRTLTGSLPTTVVYAKDGAAAVAALADDSVLREMVEVAYRVVGKINIVKKKIQQLHAVNYHACDRDLDAKLEALQQVQQEYQFEGWSQAIADKLTAADAVAMADLPEPVASRLESIEWVRKLMWLASSKLDDVMATRCFNLLAVYADPNYETSDAYTSRSKQLKEEIEAIKLSIAARD